MVGRGCGDGAVFRTCPLTLAACFVWKTWLDGPVALGLFSGHARSRLPPALSGKHGWTGLWRWVRFPDMNLHARFRLYLESIVIDS